MVAYNIYFELSAAIMLAVVLVLARVQYGLDSASGKAFIKLLVVVLVAELLDIASALLISFSQSHSLAILVGINTIYFIASALVEYYLVRYVHVRSGSSIGKGPIFIAEVALMAVYVLFVFANIFTGWIFSFDSGVYEFGPLHIVAYLFPVLFIVEAIVIMVKYREHFNKKEKIANIGFMTVSIVFMVLQATIFDDVLLSFFGASLGLLFVLFGLETPDYPKLVKALAELDALQKGLEEEVRRQTVLATDRQRKVERMSMETVQALAHAINAKDEYTNGHSSRVARYSTILAVELGWPAERVEDLYRAAILHDIGKIGVPDTILNKPGRLTSAEYPIIQSHTVVGADILQGVTEIPGAIEVARSHHERWDGTGYPDRLAGEDIPLSARLVSVADAYDAMTSRRVYRKELKPDQVRQELERGRGTQFDPTLLDVFLRLLDSGVLDDVKEEAAANSVDGKIQENFARYFGEARSGSTDYLTGLLMRSEGEGRIEEAVVGGSGWLFLYGVDNLKLVNSSGGYKMGDIVLRLTATILNEVYSDAIICRFGGDQFLCFVPDIKVLEAGALAKSAIDEFDRRKDEFFMSTSLSAGIAKLSAGQSINEALSNADKALYFVKQSGKGGYYIFGNGQSSQVDSTEENLSSMVSELVKPEKHKGAMDVSYREFSRQLEYVARLNDRYKHGFSVSLVTLEESNGQTVAIEEVERAMACMEAAIRETIRSVDACTRFGGLQFMVILLGTYGTDAQNVVDRIMKAFYRLYNSNLVQPVSSIVEVSNEDARRV